jgi:hypothetical protein
MKILWSPNLSLATPAFSLASPRIMQAIEGDDLHSYAAARVLTKDVQVFQPEPLAGLAKRVRFSDDGTPEFFVGTDEDLMMEFSEPLMYFGALSRIFEASPDAIGVLVHDPWSLPSEAVASYFGYIEDEDEQVQYHSDLISFLQVVVASLPGSKPDAPFFFTGNPLLGRLYLESQPELSAQNTLALLATAGIKFSLPRIATLTEEHLEEVHEKLGEERERYLAELNKTINQSYAALKDGDIREAYRFADFRVSTQLQSEVHNFEKAVKKLELSAAKRLGIVMMEGIPSLARAVVSPTVPLPIEIGIQLLSIFCGFLGKEWSARKLSDEYPLGSFAYKIRRGLDPAL